MSTTYLLGTLAGVTNIGGNVCDCHSKFNSVQLRPSSGEQLLYSGHIEEGAPHTEGVALMLAPEAHTALIGWEPVNSRIITAKFTTKKKDIRLNIIQCYAHTNDEVEEKKDFLLLLRSISRA